MSELNGRVLTAQTEVADKKLRLSVLEDALKNGSAADLTNILASPEIAAIKLRIAQASQREAEMRFRYTARHPALVSAEAERRDAERALAVEVRKQVDAARTEYELAVSRLGAAESALKVASNQGGEGEQTGTTVPGIERTGGGKKRCAFNTTVAAYDPSRDETGGGP
ncbi:hypothetical protein WDZ92_53380, partial [Nostoc sp. NIES-2111]